MLKPALLHLQSASATQVACVVFGELLSKRRQSGDQEDGNCDSGINLNLPCDELLNADGLQRQIDEGMVEVVAAMAKMMPATH